MRRRERLPDGKGAARYAPRRPPASDLGVRGGALSAIYYVGLVRFIGCSGYADETAKIFPDDNAMRGALAPVDFGYPMEGLRQAATLGRALGRTRAVATMIVRGKRLGEEFQRADCEVMIRGAQRLGLPPAVAKGLGDVYERWDGKGGARGVRGDRSRCQPGSSRSCTRRKFTSASVAERPCAPWFGAAQAGGSIRRSPKRC